MDDDRTALLTEVLDRQTDRFFGKYRGTVADNADPLTQGRIKADVPEVLGDKTSGWALPCSPYAGPDQGFFAIPPVGAGVWVEFEAGDASRPIWAGCWWAPNEAPTDEAGGPPTQPTSKHLRSEQGLLISLDDAAQQITVSDKAGKNLLYIKSVQGQIEVRAATKVVLEAPLIHHGDGAQHPAVFGDDLLTYLNQVVNMFNAHMHPGELAAGMLPVTPTPPVPPLTPPSPTMLSNKNLVG